MHTPQGYELRDGFVFATNWFDILFNLSMPHRFVHMLLASGLTVAFLIACISALRMLWGDKGKDVKSALRVGIIAAAALIPIQILADDMHGLNTLKHQPAKIAAMEGTWDTGPNTPLGRFAIPYQAVRENKFEIGIANGAPPILRHKSNGVVPGLNDSIADDGRHAPSRCASIFQLPHHDRHRRGHVAAVVGETCSVAQIRSWAHSTPAPLRVLRHEFQWLDRNFGRLVHN